VEEICHHASLQKIKLNILGSYSTWWRIALSSLFFCKKSYSTPTRFEWTSSSIFCYGDIKAKQIASLKNIIDYNHYEAHQDAISASRKVMNTICQQCLPLQVDSMKKQLRCF